MEYEFWEETPGNAPAAKEVEAKCDKRFAEKLYNFLSKRIGKYPAKNLWGSKKLMPVPGSNKECKLVELRFPLLGSAPRFLGVIAGEVLYFLRFTKDKSGTGKLKLNDINVAEARAKVFWQRKKREGG